MQSRVSLYKKGAEKGQKDPQKESDGKTAQRCNHKTGMLRATRSRQRQGMGFPGVSKGGTSLLTSQFQTSGLQNGERKFSIVLSHPVYGHCDSSHRELKHLLRVILGH